MDRYQLIKEILELVDSDPLNDVDISVIISRHTENMGIEQQRNVRGVILAIIRELQEDGEIKTADERMLSNITTTAAGVFLMNGGKIRSTRKRVKENEESLVKNATNPAIKIEGDVIGSIIGDQSFDSALISPAVQKTTNKSPNKPQIKSWLEVVAWIIGIIAGIVAVYEFFIKK